jgi:acyl-CoA thioesterase FadM
LPRLIGKRGPDFASCPAPRGQNEVLLVTPDLASRRLWPANPWRDPAKRPLPRHLAAPAPGKKTGGKGIHHRRDGPTYDTDAAGFLSSSQFRFAHAALEEFLSTLASRRQGHPRRRLFPVVHAEADYRAPLSVGDKLTVKVEHQAIGDRPSRSRTGCSSRTGGRQAAP